jgi:hypothetical protein
VAEGYPPGVVARAHPEPSFWPRAHGLWCGREGCRRPNLTGPLRVGWSPTQSRRGHTGILTDKTSPMQLSLPRARPAPLAGLCLCVPADCTSGGGCQIPNGMRPPVRVSGGVCASGCQMRRLRSWTGLRCKRRLILPEPANGIVRPGLAAAIPPRSECAGGLPQSHVSAAGEILL